MKMKNDRVRAEFDLENGGRLSRFELDGTITFTDDNIPSCGGHILWRPGLVGYEAGNLTSMDSRIRCH